MAFVLASVTAMLCLDVTLVSQVEQRPVVMVSAKDDTTTFTAVTTVRSTIRVIFDVTQMHTPASALTRAAIDLDVVNEVGFFHRK